MDEGDGEVPEADEGEAAEPKEPPRPSHLELKRQLKENDRRWDSKGDSEALWEIEHALLLELFIAGDVRTVLDRARRSKRVLRGKGDAKDLADAALGHWVMEQYEESASVLRRAIERLPSNRYPWSLLLRYLDLNAPAEEAIDFILSSLDRIEWRGYALVQLGAKHIDIASKAMSERRTQGCPEHLEEAHRHLEEAMANPSTDEGMRRTAERLLVLVGTLKRRLVAREDQTSDGEEGDRGTRAADILKALEGRVRAAADASMVALEGEVDADLDLDELERDAMMEPPKDDGEEEDSVTVLEVTPVTKRGKRGD